MDVERRVVVRELVHKLRIGRQLELQHLHAPARKRVGLDGGRCAERPRDLRRAVQLRIDGQAQAEILGDEVQLFIT